MKKIIPAVLLVILFAFTVPVHNEKVIINGPWTPAADTDALNGQWFLMPVLASDTATGKIPVLIFNVTKKTFTGNTGCNRMNGTFKVTDSTLLFDENIVTTKMDCPGYNEKAFLKSLLFTNRYKVEKGTLILLVNTTELSRWTRRIQKAREVKINKTT